MIFCGGALTSTSAHVGTEITSLTSARVDAARDIPSSSHLKNREYVRLGPHDIPC
jgi:hypothetical protein